MQNLIAVLLLAAAAQPRVSIKLVAPVDPAFAARHDAIAAKLSPTAKTKLQTVVTSLRSSAAITDGSSRAAILSAFPGVHLGDNDLAALTFLVAMDASKSAQDDLNAISGEIRNMESQKATLRQQLSKASVPNVTKVQVNAATVDYYRAPAPLPANATIAEKLKRLSDLGDMTQLDQQRLQQYNEQKTKTEAIASSVFKKISDTSAGIISNLK